MLEAFVGMRANVSAEPVYSGKLRDADPTLRTGDIALRARIMVVYES